MSRHKAGFTIVELMVVMAVSSVLLITTVGVYVTVLKQAPVAKERNRMGVEMREALDMINDDVRRSTAIGLYNSSPDSNAPATKIGYEFVPGPTLTDLDTRYYWRIGQDRLILLQTPMSTSGELIYDNATTTAGKKDTIIYYVRNNTLYKRIVAADYTDNVRKTVGCTVVIAGGCTDKDTVVIDSLDSSGASFSFKLYSSGGGEIDMPALLDPAGFSMLTQARGVNVSLATISNKGNGDQPIKVNDSLRMQFRTSLMSAAPTDDPVDTPVVPAVPLPPVDGFGLMVGPGGLLMQQGSFGAGKAHVDGKLYMNYYASVGSSAWSPNVAFWINNRGCGTSSNYPQFCGTGDAPIVVNRGNAFTFYSNASVCARDWVSGMESMGFMQANCTPPDRPLPTYDKAAHAAAMTRGAAGSFNCSDAISLAKGKTHAGSVTIPASCQALVNGGVYIKGDLTLSSGSSIKVSDVAGTVRPVIVVNGRVTIQNTASIQANASGTSPIIISFYSTNSTCSNSDGCVSLSSSDLKSTIDSTNYAITVNSATVVGTLYSYFGTVRLNSGARVGSVAGQRVELVGASGNYATVTMTSNVY